MLQSNLKNVSTNTGRYVNLYFPCLTSVKLNNQKVPGWVPLPSVVVFLIVLVSWQALQLARLLLILELDFFFFILSFLWWLRFCFLLVLMWWNLFFFVRFLSSRSAGRISFPSADHHHCFRHWITDSCLFQQRSSAVYLGSAGIQGSSQVWKYDG